MPSKDWFQRTSWTEKDEREFFSRLERSRTAFHKAQYLRIQALALANTQQQDLRPVALRLLDQVFKAFPDPSQLAASHLQAAECHDGLGNLETAIDHYRRALHAQSHHRGIDPGTALEFPWFVVQHCLTDLYDEALDTLKAAHLAFPVQFFKASAVRAFIAESRGDSQSALRHAREALQAAGLQESTFRYHRDLGLVGEEYRPTIERLKTLAAA